MSLRSRLRPFRRGAAYALVMGLLVFARVLPRGLGLSLFALAGGLAFLFHADARRTSLANMALAFGEKYSGRKRWLMALETFMNLGRNVFDALRLPFMSDETLLGMATVENEETLKQVLSQGKGVVVPTGHIGNWELFAAHMSERGYPVSVVAKTLKDPRLNNLLLKVRKSRGVESIDKEAGVQKILRALRKGRVLGILMDQDTKAKGIYVEFLGRKAFTPTAPAELAVKTGVP